MMGWAMPVTSAPGVRRTLSTFLRATMLPSRKAAVMALMRRPSLGCRARSSHRRERPSRLGHV
ncbi:hypothetical protein ACFPRL_06330 [Pseudoclavibacter helvolus]